MLLGQLPQPRTARHLSAMLHAAAPRGTSLIDITPADLPPVAAHVGGQAPEVARALTAAIGEVDGLLIVTPSHERSIPDALRNALDWAAEAPGWLAGKPVVIAGAWAPRSGHFAALQDLRALLLEAGASVMGTPERTLAASPHCFGGSGRCVDAELDSQVNDLMVAAAGYIAQSGREPAAR